MQDHVDHANISPIFQPENSQEEYRQSVDMANQSLNSQHQARNDKWSDIQEIRLFQLHNIHGNRWAKISYYLTGKTDNCIKNHFYCTLRKAFRRVNRYISENKTKVRLKEIKNIVLSKIISVAQQRFETKLEVNEELINLCCNIKNSLIKFAKDGSITEAIEPDLLKLIHEINDFSRSIKKRKAKRPKKYFPVNFENQNSNLKVVGNIQCRLDQTGVGRQQSQQKPIELSRSMEFNIEQLGIQHYSEKNSPFFNFQQKSPPHMINYELNSPVDELAPIFNPFSVIESNALNNCPYSKPDPCDRLAPDQR